MDLNMPRDKETGKRRGFGFLMYEDQRSTVLAVDNLNGATVLERTLRVDHVKDYKQPKIKGEDGEWLEPDEQSLNAKPQLTLDDDEDAGSDSSASSAGSIDPEDPMRDYLIAQRKEAKALKKAKKSKSKGKHKDETPEERRARKARKAEKKARKAKKASEGMRGVEELLNSLGGHPRRISRSPPPQLRRPRSRSASPRARTGSSTRRSRSPNGHNYNSRNDFDRSMGARGGGRRERSRELYRRD